MNTQQINYLTVFKTAKETIQVMQLPEFSKEAFRNMQIDRYSKMIATAKSDSEKAFAIQAYNAYSPTPYIDRRMKLKPIVLTNHLN